jgi:hypothetical protein
MSVWYGYEVPGMILMLDFKRTMRLDRSKDIYVHDSACTTYNFNACINAICVEVVALI